MKTFLFKYYLFSIFSSTDFIRGLHIVYLLELGFSNKFTGICQTLLFVSSLLFEIPSGYIADKYGKKTSLIMGTYCFFLSSAIYLLSEDMAFISFLYILQGVGFSFFSGATDALLHNNLSIYDQTNHFYKYLAKARMLSSLTLFIATVLGGILYSYGWKILFLSYLLFQLLSIVFAFLLNDSEDKSKEIKTKKQEIDTLQNTIKYTFKNTKLAYFILCVAFIEASHTPFFVFSQNLFTSKGFEAEHISFLVAVALLTSSFSYLIASMFRKIRLDKKILSVICICSSILILFFFNISIWVSALLFIIFNALPHILFVYTDTFINEHFENRYRATCLSAVSFINSLFIAFSYLAIGLLADIFTPEVSLIYLLVCLFISLLICIKNRLYISSESKIN